MPTVNGKVIQGVHWDWTISEFTPNEVLVNAVGDVEDEVQGQLKLKRLGVALFAQIEADDAANPRFQEALLRERFIPKALIQAINERGIILRQSQRKVEEHFAIQMEYREQNVLRLIPLREGRVYDQLYPDFWFATITVFDRTEKEYVIDSRHLDEIAVFDLMAGMEDKPFVVATL